MVEKLLFPLSKNVCVCVLGGRDHGFSVYLFLAVYSFPLTWQAVSETLNVCSARLRILPPPPAVWQRGERCVSHHRQAANA